jgi:hypothetical protein
MQAANEYLSSHTLDGSAVNLHQQRYVYSNNDAHNDRLAQLIE